MLCLNRLMCLTDDCRISPGTVDRLCIPVYIISNDNEANIFRTEIDFDGRLLLGVRDLLHRIVLIGSLTPMLLPSLRQGIFATSILPKTPYALSKFKPRQCDSETKPKQKCKELP